MIRKVYGAITGKRGAVRAMGVNGPLAAVLLGGWALLIAAGFLVGDAIRFLDMPLGAFVAGQGALLGVVVVGVRVAGADKR